MRRKWRPPIGFWFVFGPLMALFGAMALACLALPFFPDARQAPLVTAFNFLVGAPLFGWMAFESWRFAWGNHVATDENGISIHNARQHARLEWSEIKALWTRSKEPNAPLQLWAREQTFELPPGLAHTKELRALLEEKTGLVFGRFVFGPPMDDVRIELRGNRFLRAMWVGNAAMLGILSIVIGPLVWLYFSRVREFVEPSHWPLLAGGALACACMVLYLLGKAAFNFWRFRRHRDEVWTFDGRAVTREKAGQTIVLPLDKIEKLERAGRVQLRASGAGTTIQWPKESGYPTREEEFLEQRLGMKWQ